jgi:hypothetical protein
MIKTVRKMQESEVVESIACERSGREASFNNDPEYHEFVSINRRGGYGSIIGDGVDWTLDLCQYCLVELLGKYIRTDSGGVCNGK